jgi:hypothetical protein
MQDMILIVTPSASGPQCAELIGKALNQKSSLVTSVRQAIASVRSAEYRVIVMDEDLFEVNPAAAAGVAELADGAITVFLNFGIANSDRVIREVKAALRRASLQLQGEPSNDLTGILLSAQTAMSTPNLPVPVQERLSSFYEIARKLQLRLQAN